MTNPSEVLITEDTIKVSMISNRFDVKANILLEGSYSKSCSIPFKEELEDGTFLFEGYIQPYSFQQVNKATFYLTSEAYPYTKSNEIVKPLFVGEINSIILPLFNFDNQAFSANEITILEGYTKANENVVINLTVPSNEVIQLETQADKDGYFAIDLDTKNEGIYTFNIHSDTLNTNYSSYTIFSDRTAPTIKSAVALESGANNIMLKWECDDQDVDYYVIYRDDFLIVDANRRYTDKSYITSGTLNDQVTYKIIAVDKAGNQSEPAIKKIGDYDPPTIPENIILIDRSSKTLNITWDESVDNVEVKGYRVYRNEELISTTDKCQFTDTALITNTEYSYVIEAFDAAGNSAKSEAVTFSTITPALENVIELEKEYIIEAQAEITVSAVYKDDGNLTDHQVILRVKEKGEEDWIILSDGEVGKANINPSELGAGNFIFSAVAIDRDGTTIEKTQEFVLKYDDIVPTVSITYPKDETKNVLNKIIEIKGNTKDNVGIDHVSLEFKVNDSEAKLLTTLKPETKTADFSYNYNWDSHEISGAVTIIATAYDYRGNKSQAMTHFTVDNIPPKTPSQFGIVNTEKYIQLKWTYPNPESDFDHFVIYRSIKETTGFEKLDTINTLGFFDDIQYNAQPNIDYYYYVTSVDKLGNESEPTVVLRGIMERDVQSPEILSYLPKANSLLSGKEELSVSVHDNAALKSLIAEVYDEETQNWALLETKTFEKTNSEVAKFTWNTEGYSGDIRIRYIAEDASDNQSKITEVKYQVVPYSMPEKPQLKVDQKDGIAELNWTYSGNERLLKNYRVWVKTAEKGWKSAGYTTERVMNYSGTDGQIMFKVEAIDIKGASAESDSVEVALINPDTEKPIARMNPVKAQIKVNEAIMFDGSQSTDNCGIAEYYWDLGNGNSQQGKNFTYAYSEAGIYQVTLIVKDEAGNEDSIKGEIQVIDAENSEYVNIMISVLNRKENTTISNPEVKIRNVSGEEIMSFIADDEGKTSVLLKPGEYQIGVTANGYFAKTQNLTVDPTVRDVAVKLEKLDFIDGKLTATELTYDEMVGAGINVNDPDNQHVYKFEVKLEFTAGLEIPVTLYKNNAGRILSVLDGVPGFFEGSFSAVDQATNTTITVHPITEKFYLVVVGETKWLKQMFDVRLVVLNTSDSLDIENCTAELILPEGISLAEMINGGNKDTKADLGTIENTLSKTTDWFIRGDHAGSYNLSAKISGEIDNESFEIEYQTEKPIRVLNPDETLRMHITAPDAAYYAEDYTFTISLENISDQPVYGLSYVIQSLDQYKVVQIGDKETKLPITHEDLDPETCGIQIDELAPGATVSFEITTKVLFNSILEIAKKIPSLAGEIPSVESQALAIASKVMDVINVRYFLNNVFVTKLEGSTAAIDYDVTITHTRFPIVLEAALQELSNLGRKELAQLFPDITIGNMIADEVFNFCEKTPEVYLQEMKDKGSAELPKIKVLEDMKSIYKVVNPSANTKVVISVLNNKRSIDETISLRCVEGESQTSQETNQIEMMGSGRFEIIGKHSGEANVLVKFADGKAYLIPVKVIGEEDTILNQANAEVIINDNKPKISDLEQLLEEVKSVEEEIKAKNPLYPVKTILNIDLTDKDVFTLALSSEDLIKINESGVKLTIITKSGRMMFNCETLAEILQKTNDEVIFGIEEVRQDKPENYASIPLYRVLIQSDGQETALDTEKICVEIPYTVDLNKMDFQVIRTDFVQNENIDFIYDGTMVKLELNQSENIGFLVEMKKQNDENNNSSEEIVTPINPEATNSKQSTSNKSVIINKTEIQSEDLLQQTWKEVLNNLVKDEKSEIHLNANVESIPVEVIKALSESDNTLVITMPDGTQVKIDSEMAKQIDLDGKAEILISDLLAQKNEMSKNEEDVKVNQTEKQNKTVQDSQETKSNQGISMIFWILILIILIAIGYFVIKKMK